MGKHFISIIITNSLYIVLNGYNLEPLINFVSEVFDFLLPYIPLIVALINVGIGPLSKYSTNFERHSSDVSFQASKIIKSSILFFLNTVVIPYLWLFIIVRQYIDDGEEYSPHFFVSKASMFIL